MLGTSLMLEGAFPAKPELPVDFALVGAGASKNGRGQQMLLIVIVITWACLDSSTAVMTFVRAGVWGIDRGSNVLLPVAPAWSAFGVPVLSYISRVPPSVFIKNFLVSSVGAYVAVRLAIAAYAALAMEWQDIDSKNRLANIRLVPREVVPTVVDAYTAKLKRNRKNVILLGDSQTYGFTRPVSSTWGGLLNTMPPIARAGFSVHNLAVINGTFRDSVRILESVAARGVAVHAIVLSTNPTHFQKSASLAPEADFYILRQQERPSVFVSLLWTKQNVFDLTGLTWRTVRKLHPVDFFDDTKRFSENFVLADVGRDYCSNLDTTARMPDLKELIHVARKMAQQLILFTQSRYYADYFKAPYHYEWAPAAVDSEVVKVGQAGRCDVVLDLANEFPRDHFNDLIHLNQRGHEAMAKIIASHLLGTGVSADNTSNK